MAGLEAWTQNFKISFRHFVCYHKIIFLSMNKNQMHFPNSPLHSVNSRIKTKLIETVYSN